MPLGGCLLPGAGGYVSALGGIYFRGMSAPRGGVFQGVCFGGVCSRGVCSWGGVPAPAIRGVYPSMH